MFPSRVLSCVADVWCALVFFVHWESIGTVLQCALLVVLLSSCFVVFASCDMTTSCEVGRVVVEDVPQRHHGINFDPEIAEYVSPNNTVL